VNSSWAARPALAVILGLATVATSARAETLADAIALAYQTNPTLQAQRSQVRAADEGYVQARAALGPTLEAQATATYNQNRLGYTPPLANNTGQAQITLSQPLYTGGRGALGLSVAADQVRQAREALRAAEGNVMLAVIQAYADVLRDAGVLAVRAKNLKVLIDQVVETKARVRAGELTLTDTSQAEAQVANERALYSTAQGQLQLSRAEYATAVGQNPGDLVSEPPLPGLPTTVDEAFDLAEDQSPEIRQARFAEQASRDQAAQAKAAFRPSVSLSVLFGYTGELAPFDPRRVERTVTGEVVVSQPLFASGLLASQARAALDQNTTDRIAIETTRRGLVQNVANAWNQMQVARNNTGFEAEQIRAAGVAFKGMRIEYKEGLRTTLDVLTAEETLRDAEIAQLAALHDQYVAEASLLRVVGRLEGPDLVPGLPQYDVATHLRQVEKRGEVPWTPLVEKLDALGAPGAGQRAIPAPEAIRHRPEIATAPAPPSGELVTTLPVEPVPGTTSPAPPPARSSN
jgi:outer membrane protein